MHVERGMGGGQRVRVYCMNCEWVGWGSNIQGRSEERSGGCNLMPEFNRLVSAYI